MKTSGGQIFGAQLLPSCDNGVFRGVAFKELGNFPHAATKEKSLPGVPGQNLRIASFRKGRNVGDRRGSLGLDEIVSALIDGCDIPQVHARYAPLPWSSSISSVQEGA
jgi:hypothetical protein